MGDMCEKEFNDLTHYANDLGFEVKEDVKRFSHINYSKKTIEKSVKLGVAQGLYLLAHECGHAEQYNEFTDEKAFFQYHSYVNDNPYRLVEWEYDAWKRAYRLLKEFDICDKYFIRIACRNLYTYIIRKSELKYGNWGSRRLVLKTLWKLLLIKFRLYMHKKIDSRCNRKWETSYNKTKSIKKSNEK